MSSHHTKPQPSYRKAPEAPRRFKSAYMFFSTYKHKLVRAELGSEATTPLVAKKISQAWKELSKDERAIWEQKAELDRARYELEKADYNGPWKVLKHSKSKADPNQPKRPPSAFLIFSKDNREAVKAAHPKLRTTEMSKILSEMWKAVPEDERAYYMDQALARRRMYGQEIAQYRRAKLTERQQREGMMAQKAINLGLCPAPPVEDTNPSYPNHCSERISQRDRFVPRDAALHPGTEACIPLTLPDPGHHYRHQEVAECTLPHLERADWEAAVQIQSIGQQNLRMKQPPYATSHKEHGDEGTSSLQDLQSADWEAALRMESVEDHSTTAPPGHNAVEVSESRWEETLRINVEGKAATSRPVLFDARTHASSMQSLQQQANDNNSSTDVPMDTMTTFWPGLFETTTTTTTAKVPPSSSPLRMTDNVDEDD